MNRPSPDDMKVMQVMEYVEKVEKENKEFKEKIEGIKKAYIEFEKVETEYNKKLGVLDKLIMNR